MALLGNVVVRRPGEAEVYAETADVHERSWSGNPAGIIRRWRTRCVPPARVGAWPRIPAPCPARRPCAGIRPCSEWVHRGGFAALLRSTSLYRSLDRDIREPLLDAIAERIRTRMDDRAPRRYLSVLRVGSVPSPRPEASDRF
jgi:hypothetical protein